jgi:tetratricopeptide (TPR) repeat protein
MARVSATVLYEYVLLLADADEADVLAGLVEQALQTVGSFRVRSRIPGKRGGDGLVAELEAQTDHRAGLDPIRKMYVFEYFSGCEQMLAQQPTSSHGPKHYVGVREEIRAAPSLQAIEGLVEITGVDPLAFAIALMADAEGEVPGALFHSESLDLYEGRRRFEQGLAHTGVGGASTAFLAGRTAIAERRARASLSTALNPMQEHETQLVLGSALYAERRDLDGSVAALSRALAVAETEQASAEAELALGLTYELMGDSAQADHAFDAASGGFYTESGVQNMRANALYELEWPDAAAAAYRKAIAAESQNEPNNVSRCSLATVLALQDKFGEARPLYEEGLAIDSDAATDHRGLATVLFELGLFLETAKELDKALTLDRYGAPTYFLLARLLRATGFPERALAALSKACELFGFACDEPARAAQLTYLRGLILADLRDYDGALRQLEDAERSARTAKDIELRLKALTARARVLGLMAEFEPGRRACEEVLALRPDDRTALATLAWLLFHQGRLEEAESAIRRATRESSSQELGRTLGREESNAHHEDWSVYAVKATILNSLALAYADGRGVTYDLSASAIRAARRAEALIRDRRNAIQLYYRYAEAASGPSGQVSEDGRPADFAGQASTVNGRLGDASAHVMLERARAHILREEYRDARFALTGAIRNALPDSLVQIASQRLWGELRSAPRLQISNAVILTGILILTVLVAALGFHHDLTGVSLTTTLLAIPVIGLSAYLLPVLTKLRIGGVELEKTIARAPSETLAQLAPPPPPLEADLRLPLLLLRTYQPQ